MEHLRVSDGKFNALLVNTIYVLDTPIPPPKEKRRQWRPGEVSACKKKEGLKRETDRRKDDRHTHELGGRVKVKVPLKDDEASINTSPFPVIFGDLFMSPLTSSLAHCVSEDLHMGKGIATIFKKTFKRVEQLKSQGTTPMCPL